MPARTICDAGGQSLQWVQPHAFVRAYDLRAGESVVATLRFRNCFSSQATGLSTDGCWTFKRTGFLTTHVTVRACGTGQDVARFRKKAWSSGGTLELPDGRAYPANSNFWQTRYEIRTASGERVLTFRRVRGLLHLSSEVDVDARAVGLPELACLVMLGWYLTVMQHNDAAPAIA